MLGGVHCDVSCGEPPSIKVPATSTSTSTSTSTTTHTSTRTPTRTPTRTSTRKSTRTATRTSTVIKTVTSKPKAASTQRTVVSDTIGGCHQTCSINEAEGDFDCYFSCNEDFATTIGPTPVAEAVLHQRTVVSVTHDDCTAVCWDLMPGSECDIQCTSSDLKTQIPGNIALSWMFSARISFDPYLCLRFIHHLLTVSHHRHQQSRSYCPS